MIKLRMSFPRWSRRGAAVAALALAAGALTGVDASAGVAGTPPVANPYSPAYRHPYRHGVVPTRGQLTKMRQWASGHPARRAAATASADDLSYGGGIDGIGITTGHEKVYLVFYGSQWGTISASGDSQGEAPYVQELLKGLGTGGELWSGVMTQYCEGIAAGSQTCPVGNSQHVAYPSGGALAGVALR